MMRRFATLATLCSLLTAALIRAEAGSNSVTVPAEGKPRELSASDGKAGGRWDAASTRRPASAFQDGWRDASPHRSAFVTVNGVRLHYLDWGGKGEALLFLHGMYNSAHIFDELAPKFTDRYRVLGLTRRGHGQSDKPSAGYDTDTLVEDIRQFLDAMKIKRASLVGHSMAGTEMTRFAILHPQRVKKLVYLDAALDYDREFFDIVGEAPPEPPPTPEDLASFDAFRKFYKVAKCGWTEAWEADLRNSFVYSSDGRPLRAELTDEVAQALQKGMRESRPEYAKVKAPALNLMAMGRFAECSFAPNPDEATRQKTDHFIRIMNQYRRKNIERFKKEAARGRVVEVLNSDHYFFIPAGVELVREMRAFLAGR
jgi:non-heme chloroperoxidase